MSRTNRILSRFASLVAQSFRNAVFLAMDIIRNRREFDALSANTLRAARRDNIVDEDITTELQKDDEPAI